MRATWGKRCNKILIMSSMADDEVPTVKLELGDGGDKYSHLWGKTKSAFRYVYQNHFEEYDWFVKADDDTYMVVENLRYLLKDFNSSSPLYFGRKFKPFVKQGYMSGGAGYVLSKEALRRLVEVCKSVFVCKNSAILFNLIHSCIKSSSRRNFFGSERSSVLKSTQCFF